MGQSRKALIIGIDDYPDTPLKCCCNDADAIKQLLSFHEDGSPNFSVKKLKNVNKKGDLKQYIYDCFSGDEEIALFYFSGHGYIDSLGGYLVTPDYSDNDYGVSFQDVITIVNQSNCRNKIIILDCCYSGSMGSINTQGQQTAIINEGVSILTACTSKESAIEYNGHGLFTELIISALKGGASDITGHITPGGIYSYIDKTLGPWDQRPVFKTNVSRFISLRDVKPQVDVSIIRKLKDYFATETDTMNLDPSFEPTNTPDDIHRVIFPYADPTNTKIFDDLQQLEGIGLVVPVGERHMYYAAMNSKSCRLTSIGKHYWRLVKEGKI